jgi:hypothetical protein
MKLSYKVTLADWKAAIRLHSRQKIGRRIHFFVYDFVIPTLAVLAVGYIILADSTERTDIVDGLAIPVTALAALAIILPFWRTYLIRKGFKGMFPPSDDGPGYSLDIDDERILSIRPGLGEAKYYWTGICAVAQSKKIILLYISEILFLGIPPRVLSPEQRVELDNLIVQHVPKRSKP